MVVAMPAAQFFRAYADVLQRVDSRGFAGDPDITDAMRLLAFLHGAGELRMSVTTAERDTLSGHLVRTVVNGKLDDDARKDLATTDAYLSER